MQNNDIDKLFIKYNKALNLLKEKFKKLEKDNLGDENPISYIKTRIKSEQSIENKLKDRFNLEYTATNIEEKLNDIAGIRIVCPFLSDINKIIDFVNNDPDITVIGFKNYINNPKINGYSGYHLIVSVPVLTNGEIKQVKAEIQIRTIAVDAILSLEHKLRYKSNVELTEEDDNKILSIIEFCNLIDCYADNFIQKRRNNHPIKQIEDKEINIDLKKYSLALAKVESIIEKIEDEYKKEGLINPIEHIKGRIKPIPSIISKLKEKNKDITQENIEKYITDIGAIKIVCSFLSDAKDLISILNNQTDFIILESQDYISTPKEFGYSSYHYIIGVPIEIDGITEVVKIELQVRTIIKDFWANLEHILCYKKKTNFNTRKQLKKIADILNGIELDMEELAQKIISKIKEKRKIKDKSN